MATAMATDATDAADKTPCQKEFLSLFCLTPLFIILFFLFSFFLVIVEKKIRHLFLSDDSGCDSGRRRHTARLLFDLHDFHFL